MCGWDFEGGPTAVRVHAVGFAYRAIHFFPYTGILGDI